MNARAPFVVLDDTRPGRERLTLFVEPAGTIVAQEPSEVAAGFAAIERALAQGLHVAGYFSYELGYALEPRLTPLMPRERKVPLLWFGLFRAREEFHARAAEGPLARRVAGRAYAGPLRFTKTPESYARGFRTAQEYIRAGDIYQANLTFRGRFAFMGDPLALYLGLRPRAGGAHCAYIEDGGRAVLSLSPELFFDIDRRVIATRPMKGTAARGSNAAEDARARAHLAASEKDRAENLMIVDLIRNDLSRIAETGSVRVDDLFAVETYPTLHQMVSGVHARLRDRAKSAAVVKALFPCGSVTGAPKIRAMEIIRELERDARGIYCGAVGTFSPDGSAHFNVAIRTLTLTENEGELGVGGALVADSELAGEYAECLLKARYFTEAHRPLALLETLRHTPQEGFVRTARHLARMARSARAFAIPFDENAARHTLHDTVRGVSGPSRVRLRLDENGVFTGERDALAPAREAIWSYAISDCRVQSTDALLRHKTDWRELYDGERSRLGCDEVIFLNERGEVTEGSRSTVFARFGLRLVTPPLSCGALDGCLRRELLEDASARCEEGVLRPADLERADAVYLGNSLRGLMRAAPVVPAMPAAISRRG